MRHPPPDPPYVGPARHDGGPGNKPIRRIVIHETQSRCIPGAARAVARYFRTTDRPASAHYIVDPGEVVQCVYDDVVAYHAPPNDGSIGVELCGITSADLARWSTRERRRMTELAVQLVAELCLAYDVPPYYVGPTALKRGERGVTTHAAVGKAWGQTDHWDPGAWPRRAFMRQVRARVRELKERRGGGNDG